MYIINISFNRDIHICCNGRIELLNNISSLYKIICNILYIYINLKFETSSYHPPCQFFFLTDVGTFHKRSWLTSSLYKTFFFHSNPTKPGHSMKQSVTVHIYMDLTHVLNQKPSDIGWKPLKDLNLSCLRLHTKILYYSNCINLLFINSKSQIKYN